MFLKKILKKFSVFFLALYFFAGCGLQNPYTSSSYKSSTEEIPLIGEIELRILLIGDAGRPSLKEREPVLKALEKNASEIPEKTLIIFLGDNIYPGGLEISADPSTNISQKFLEEQIKVVENSGAEAVFIPGNHDWGMGLGDGWEKIKEQQKLIESKKIENLKMLPGDGCPGPVFIDKKNVRIIFLDTQWWIHQNEKPTPENSSCRYVTEEEIIESLDQYISEAENKFVIVAGHHPLKTYGSHGGYFDWKDHLFPFRIFNPSYWIPVPVFGSLHPLMRTWGMLDQDVSGSAYKNMINKIEPIISKYDNLIYASGHEHSIQILEGKGDNYYLVSGVGTSYHAERVFSGERTIFANSEPGFIQIDILNDGRKRLSVFHQQKNSENWEEFFSMWLNNQE